MHLLLYFHAVASYPDCYGLWLNLESCLIALSQDVFPALTARTPSFICVTLVTHVLSVAGLAGTVPSAPF